MPNTPTFKRLTQHVRRQSPSSLWLSPTSYQVPFDGWFRPVAIRVSSGRSKCIHTKTDKIPELNHAHVIQEVSRAIQNRRAVIADLCELVSGFSVDVFDVTLGMFQFSFVQCSFHDLNISHAPDSVKPETQYFYTALIFFLSHRNDASAPTYSPPMSTCAASSMST